MQRRHEVHGSGLIPGSDFANDCLEEVLNQTDTIGGPIVVPAPKSARVNEKTRVSVYLDVNEAELGLRSVQLVEL